MKNRIYKHIDHAEVDTSHSPCGNFRYSLTVDYGLSKGNQTLCVIMENPSYACKEYADKSVQFLEKLVFIKGYEEFAEVSRLIIVNQFAFVQTKDFEGTRDQIGETNDVTIEEMLKETDVVLIAWGKTNKHRERMAKIRGMIKEASVDNIYMSKKHPSRGSYKDFILECKV